jgi:hypothetical protein
LGLDLGHQALRGEISGRDPVDMLLGRITRSYFPLESHSGSNTLAGIELNLVSPSIKPHVKI